MKSNVFKKVTSMACAAAMVATMGISAFAIDANPVVASNLSTNGKVAAITKYLQVPTGTTLPDAGLTFSYTITPDASGDLASAGAITRTVTITNGTTKGTATDDETTTYVASTEALFNQDDFAFPHAGQYVFDVAETNAGATGVTYDTQKYKLYVNVANDTTADTLKVTDIFAVDPDTASKSVTTGNYDSADKIAIGSYTDTDADDEVDQFEDCVTGSELRTALEANGLSYTNKYVKATNVTPDGNDEDGSDPTKTTDDTGLYIQKNVAGDYADKTKAFTFTVKVTAPALSSKTTYTACIYDLDTNTAGADITFTSGVAQDITLTDQQRLVFKDLDIGADYEVTEAAATGYSANLTGAQTGNVQDTASNSVRYVNTYETNPITGIMINNAPYIILAVLAIGGMTAYVVRRREEAE